MSPQYRLLALNKKTEQRGKVGAGWRNEDGSISIRVNPWVVIDSNPDVILTLFPVKPEEAEE